MDVQTRGDCPNCGAVLAEDAWFCQRCGSPVPQGGEEQHPEGSTPEADWRSLVHLWGPRVAAAALVLATAVAVAFAMLVLVFDVFVES